MKPTFWIQEQHPRDQDSLSSRIQGFLAREKFDKVSVAVAYSSVAGVSNLRDLVLAENSNASFQWFLGVDDYITQPGAIEGCLAFPNSDVRIFKSAKPGARFHSKFYLFESTKNRAKALGIIGSANLTYSAFYKNCESVAFIHSNTRGDHDRLRKSYNRIWRSGVSPDAAFLRDYAEQFQRFLPERRFLQEDDNRKSLPGRAKKVLESDSALIGPELAKICWIEVGKNTAMGRELEFKAEQAKFFGLDPAGSDPEFKDFILEDSRRLKLRMKYQVNSMWRLQLTRDIPEVAHGLRPTIDGRLGRSPFVAVFERVPGRSEFKLKFIHVDSTDFSLIKEKSMKMGTLGQTSARIYGWH